MLFKTVTFLICLIFAGCQSTTKLEPNKSNLEKLSQISIKKAKNKNRNQLKFVGESAILLTYLGEYQKAESYYEKAWQLQDSAYTRSTTELILSKIVNENTKKFRGHYLERWHLRLMSAINYLAQNKRSSALVEVRRLSELCRLSKDPFEEKVIKQARLDYLVNAGLLFSILGRPEEGKVDLRYAVSEGAVLPNWLNEQSWFWENKKPSKTKNKLSLRSPHPDKKLYLKVRLKGVGPRKKEQRLNITMFGVFPIIQAYMDGKGEPSEVDKVTDIATGALGKRLIEIAYPVMKSDKTYSINQQSNFSLNYGQLYHDSWDAQKNRLIAQSALRIISKVYAAYQVEQAIEKNVEGPWGQILGNLGRLALWKTEQADIRQIEFLPYQISFDWMWDTVDDTDEIKVQLFREELF